MDWVNFVSMYRKEIGQTIPPQAISDYQKLVEKFGGQTVINVAMGLQSAGNRAPLVTEVAKTLKKGADTRPARTSKASKTNKVRLTDVVVKPLTAAERAEIEQGWNESRKALETVLGNDELKMAFWADLKASPSVEVYRWSWAQMRETSPIIQARAKAFLATQGESNNA